MTRHQVPLFGQPDPGPVDLEDLARQDQANTLRTLQAKVSRGQPLKPGERKQLARLEAAGAGRHLVATIEEAAAALQVTGRTVKAWLGKGAPGPDGAGAYDVDALRAWRAGQGNGNGHALPAQLAAPGGAPGGDPAEPLEPSLDEQIKTEQLALARIKRQQAEGALVSRKEVGRLFAARVLELKTGLQALPRAAARDLVEGLDLRERERLLEEHVERILRHYARPLPARVAPLDDEGSR